MAILSTYVSLPHNLIKEKLIDLIERTFQRKWSLCVACNDGNVFFTSEEHKRYILRPCQKVCEALIFLLDNVYIRFGTKLCRQIVGIPMGTNCAPLVAATDLMMAPTWSFQLSRHGPDDLSLVEPTGVQVLDFCCSSVSELVCCWVLVLFHLGDEYRDQTWFSIHKHSQGLEGGLKTEGEARGFQHLPRDLRMLMNDKIMFDRYYSINSKKTHRKMGTVRALYSSALPPFSYARTLFTPV